MCPPDSSITQLSLLGMVWQEGPELQMVYYEVKTGKRLIYLHICKVM